MNTTQPVIERGIPIPARKLSGGASGQHSMEWMKANPSMTKNAIRQREKRKAARATKRE
jgi:hypothetical protein